MLRDEWLSAVLLGTHHSCQPGTNNYHPIQDLNCDRVAYRVSQKMGTLVSCHGLDSPPVGDNLVTLLPNPDLEPPQCQTLTETHGWRKDLCDWLIDPC
ncbi:rCG27946 [Rattus norvegicus]|uniref:RCG27946 n=1 Tax=Rattus norvegicus TaxID=10116 RepID=A6IE98_RAT|nr:rCG27946 [Rattus norvegicus]